MGGLSRGNKNMRTSNSILLVQTKKRKAAENKDEKVDFSIVYLFHQLF
jgi:hypothetical protein